MNIKTVNFVYFSPTDSTKKILELIAACFDLKPNFIDMTPLGSEKNEITFGKDDFVLFALPVYSGRVPKTFVERLKNLKGSNTPCAVIATYGNREFNDSVLEMSDIAKKAGFITIGALAAVTEHSVVRIIAAGRPDESDKAAIKDFAQAINKRFGEITDISKFEAPKLPGKRPYRRYIELPMAPKSNKACNGCKACVKVCPVGALSFDGGVRTDKKKCIGCMKCVRVCPKKARTMGKLKMTAATLFMKIVANKYKKTGMYL